jgi:PD-(D/E)XK nuclease superfamily
MKLVEEFIKRNINDKNSFFVFPSELVSTFWMKKSLEYGKNTVLSKRFLSWDKFKEKTFSLNMEISPVNTHIRTLFASSLLEENKKENIFFGLIKPEYSKGSSAFLSRLTAILTELKGFKEDKGLRDISLDAGVRKDLEFLYISYTRFLNDKEMFEPSWIRPDLKDIGKQYNLFFSEVIEDFKDFSSDLEKSSFINIISMDKSSINNIEHFSSSTLELKSLLGKIGKLLDSGIRVQDIAITLPDMDNWRYELESEACLRSIPLDFRQGKKLSEYPGAMLIRNILNCGKSGFSISSMKQILLNSSIPWKEKETARQLFHFGINHHCFKNYILKGKELDVWKDALIKSEEEELSFFYQNLKSSIEKIIISKTFSELKVSVQIFISSFLNTDLWSSGTLREFQFCLDTLNDLEDASKKAGINNYGSSSEIWLSSIDERIYVKRSESMGISIFPYRVSAGALFPWHFIPGLSQTSSSVVKSKFQFLRDNQRADIPGLDLDFTEPFLNLYNLSGENVVFSFSTDSFNGPSLPPSVFVLGKVVSDIKNSVSFLTDEYLSEFGYWSGLNPLPDRIFTSMKKGIDFALSSIFNNKKIDYTKEIISPQIIHKEIEDRFLNDKGFVSISPSSLDQFTACPFNFLLTRGFGLRDDVYSETYIDHPVFGQILHECFDRFFKYVEASGTGFSRTLTQEYKTEISSIIDKVFNRYIIQGESFIAPVWNYCREFTHNKLHSFIDIEVVQFPGFRLASTEKQYSCQWEEMKIELTGRIDRVSYKGDKTAIIDYKKKNHLKRKDILNSESTPLTFQIPFYIYLVEQGGLKVSSASYYNVTDCKYDHVFNPEVKKSWCSQEDISILNNKLEKSVILMSERIREGDFTIPSDGCESCDFRRICRTKYHVR